MADTPAVPLGRLGVGGGWETDALVGERAEGALDLRAAVHRQAHRRDPLLDRDRLAPRLADFVRHIVLDARGGLARTIGLLAAQLGAHTRPHASAAPM